LLFPQKRSRISTFISVPDVAFFAFIPASAAAMAQGYGVFAHCFRSLISKKLLLLLAIVKTGGIEMINVPMRGA
jgi:hypothetical protein